jgi:hypothetical protein
MRYAEEADLHEALAAFPAAELVGDAGGDGRGAVGGGSQAGAQPQAEGGLVADFGDVGVEGVEFGAVGHASFCSFRELPPLLLRVGKPSSWQESRLGVSKGDEGSPMDDSGLSPESD